jgi:uncharacterized protein (TIGR03546 family)
MVWRLVRPLRVSVEALLAGDSSRQLAAGFALGMVLGLMPKGNLIALSLCVLLFALRVNKPLALVAAVMFTCVGPLADSFTHQLGAEVLRIGVLQPGFASVYKLPLGPWIGLHNTVVMGSLLVGLYLVYPVYWAGQAGSRWLEAQSSIWDRPANDARPSMHIEGEVRREAA